MARRVTPNTEPKRLDLSIDDLGCSVRVTNALGWELVSYQIFMACC